MKINDKIICPKCHRTVFMVIDILSNGTPELVSINSPEKDGESGYCAVDGTPVYEWDRGYYIEGRGWEHDPTDHSYTI